MAKRKPKTQKTIKRKGRKITLKKVKPFGKNKNLQWKITKNQKI